MHMAARTLLLALQTGHSSDVRLWPCACSTCRQGGARCCPRCHASAHAGHHKHAAAAPPGAAGTARPAPRPPPGPAAGPAAGLAAPPGPAADAAAAKRRAVGEPRQPDAAGARRPCEVGLPCLVPILHVTWRSNNHYPGDDCDAGRHGSPLRKSRQSHQVCHIFCRGPTATPHPQHVIIGYALVAPQESCSCDLRLEGWLVGFHYRRGLNTNPIQWRTHR